MEEERHYYFTMFFSILENGKDIKSVNAIKEKEEEEDVSGGRSSLFEG